MEVAIKKEDVTLSLQSITQSLATLVNVHEKLIGISKEKTEVLKEGSAEDLQQLLIHEQKYIHKLELAEHQREIEVKTWFTNKQLMEEDYTITRMLELLTNDDEKHQLEQAAVALTKEMTQLKENEQLNEALIKQSMQFIQMSLSMMQPTLEKMNYNRPKQQAQSSNVREHSVFDSKA